MIPTLRENSQRNFVGRCQSPKQAAQRSLSPRGRAASKKILMSLCKTSHLGLEKKNQSTDNEARHIPTVMTVYAFQFYRLFQRGRTQETAKAQRVSCLVRFCSRLGGANQVSGSVISGPGCGTEHTVFTPLGHHPCPLYRWAIAYTAIFASLQF
jgi:hypothetical protein